MFEPYSLEWDVLKPDADQKRKTGKFYSVIILTVPRESMVFHMGPLGSTLVGQKVERMELKASTFTLLSTERKDEAE